MVRTLKKEKISPLKKKCSKCQNSELAICVYCSKNFQKTDKLDALKFNAEKIEDYSRRVIATTENLFMPMIQLSYIFPSILIWFCSDFTLNNDSKEDSRAFVYEVIDYVYANWTFRS